FKSDAGVRFAAAFFAASFAAAALNAADRSGAVTRVAAAFRLDTGTLSPNVNTHEGSAGDPSGFLKPVDQRSRMVASAAATPSRISSAIPSTLSSTDPRL